MGNLYCLLQLGRRDPNVKNHVNCGVHVLNPKPEGAQNNYLDLTESEKYPFSNS